MPEQGFLHPFSELRATKRYISEVSFVIFQDSPAKFERIPRAWLGTPDLFKAAKLALQNRASGGFHPEKGAMQGRLKDGNRALASGDSMPVGPRIIGSTPPKYAAFPELFVQSQTDAIEILGPSGPENFPMDLSKHQC